MEPSEAIKFLLKFVDKHGAAKLEKLLDVVYSLEVEVHDFGEGERAKKIVIYKGGERE